MKKIIYSAIVMIVVTIACKKRATETTPVPTPAPVCITDVRTYDSYTLGYTFNKEHTKILSEWSWIDGLTDTGYANYEYSTNQIIAKTEGTNQQTIYYLNKLGDIDSSLETDDDVLMKIWNKYDNAGHLIYKLELGNFFGTPYFYRLKQEWSNGNIVKMTSFNSEVDSLVYAYTYDNSKPNPLANSDRLIQRSGVQNVNELIGMTDNSGIAYTYTYEWDQNGKLLKQICTDPNGKITLTEFNWSCN